MALHLTASILEFRQAWVFIALFGICIQNGVILISEFHSNLKRDLNWFILLEKPSGKNTTRYHDCTHGSDRVIAAAVLPGSDPSRKSR